MRGALVQYLLGLALFTVALVLLLVLTYFAWGSLELHPTEEEQAKIRLITGLLATFLMLIAVSLWRLSRRCSRTSRSSVG